MKDGEAMEIVVSEETTALEVQTETGDLLKMAVSKDLDVDKLEKLIELKNREDERKCKQDFDRHFVEMQKEFTPIKRNKKGDKGNYAPVDELQKKYGIIIANHGFSYTWNEENLDNGSLKTTMIISGYGHTRSNQKVLPVYEPDKGSQSGKAIMNVLQAEGTRSTYNCRYTFKAGFGITETDEDTDGNLNFEDGVQYAREIEWIRTCKTKEDLKKTWTEVWTELANDKIGRDVLTIVYNEKKKEFIK